MVLAVVLLLQVVAALGVRRGRSGLHEFRRDDGRAQRRRGGSRVHGGRGRAVAHLGLSLGKWAAGRRGRDHGKVAVAEVLLRGLVLVAAGGAAGGLLHRVQADVCEGGEVGVVVLVG